MSLKLSNYWAESNNRVNFSHHHPHKYQLYRSRFEQAIFRPAHGQFRLTERKTSLFRSERNTQVKSDPSYQNQVSFDSTTEIKPIRSQP